MTTVSIYLGIVALILFQAYSVFFTVYQSIVSIVGLVVQSITAYRTRFDMKKEYMLKKRFALIVCAHNEATVIGEIVANLVDEMEYPKDLYDVFVIADNCTDNTADIVRQYGGIAMERHDAVNKSKGFGLEWMFNKLWEMEDQGEYYDALCVFDADNLVTPNFLKEMNKKLMDGHEVIQGYLDSKNPRDTWVTKSYAVAYWSTNFIFQNIRNGLGLSAQLGGTGMCMTTRILKEIGWGTKSLTEDLEFTAKYVAKTGRPVAWCHTASVFDEKLLEFKPTLKQRTRWMIGHINCMFAQGPTMLKQAIKKRSLLHFDIAVYLAQPIRVSLLAFMLIPLVLSLSRTLPMEFSKYILNSGWWTAFIILQFLLPVVSLLIEKKKIMQFLYLGWSFLFGFSWMYVTVIAFFRLRQREWNPTKHTRVVKLDQVTKKSMSADEMTINTIKEVI